MRGCQFDTMLLVCFRVSTRDKDRRLCSFPFFLLCVSFAPLSCRGGLRGPSLGHPTPMQPTLGCAAWPAVPQRPGPDPPHPALAAAWVALGHYLRGCATVFMQADNTRFARYHARLGFMSRTVFGPREGGHHGAKRAAVARGLPLKPWLKTLFLV